MVVSSLVDIAAWADPGDDETVGFPLDPEEDTKAADAETQLGPALQGLGRGGERVTLQFGESI